MSPFSLLRSQLRPGMTVVDIGANVGDLTHCMADAVGPTGHVYAIEPCAATVSAAQHRFADTAQRRDPVAPVTWLTVAVGRQDEQRWLYHSDECSRHTLYRTNRLIGTDKDTPDEWVTVRSLNSLQATGELPRHIDFIKIDAQGAEDDIFAGASALLAAGQTVWMVEMWPAGLYGAGSSVDRLIDRLRQVHHFPDEDQTWTDVRTLAGKHEGHSAFDLIVRPS